MVERRLEMAGVSLRRNGQSLLSDISLDLDLTGTTVVMGANGAGKSLFLSLAHGVLSPSSGTVLWSGKSAAATRRSRSIMFQATPILRRSVAANVAFPLLAAGMAKADRRERVAQALETARLSDRAQQPAAQLSGGERQRMALARALVSAPDAVLMDEPAANLDPASTRALENVISAAAGRGVSILISCHDIGQARRLADRVIFLSDGRVAETGPATKVLSNPESQAMRAYFAGEI